MLALSKVIQKVEKRLDIQFSQVKYTLFGVVSTLFIEKVDIGLIIPQ